MMLRRALLRLYPASFRADYGAELERTMAELSRERGRIGGAIAAITDVIPNALAAHRDLLAQDLRYMARTLARSKGFAIATILITALGVGANTATFSVADFVLLRPLPYPDADELVRLCEGPRTGAGWGCYNQLSPANWRDVRERNRSFTGLGALAGAAVNLVGAGEPLRVSAAQVTPDVLPILGVRPILGRWFDSTAAGEADASSVIIGHSLWQSHFGGDSAIVGASVSLDGMPRVVIGVMPSYFRFPAEEVQLWMPLLLREEAFANRGQNRFLDGVARLRPGVTFEQARADVAGIFTQLAREYPETNAETWFTFFRQRDQMAPRYRTMLLALVGASLCMLLLTCANLANLFLARAAGRERELAVRAAIGAGRERLVRQMLTESITLALAGGIAGAVVAVYTVPLLSHLVPSTLPIASRPAVDVRVFAFAAAFAALTGIGFGLIPALRAGGHAGFAALREGARGGGGMRAARLRAVLVSVEVAVSVVLLISSGLLIRAMWQVQAVGTGFTTESVLTLRTALPGPTYQDSVRRAEFLRRVITGVRALPGVEAAAYTSGLPLVFTGGLTNIVLPGAEERRDGRELASIRLVTSGFFATLGIPLREGRDVSELDTPDRLPVAVISESFARQFWPGQDPLGRTFETRGQRRTVVGVVGDIRVRGLERGSEPQLYLPAWQPWPGIPDLYQPKDLVVRSAGPDPGLVAEIRELVRQVDPRQPISNVRKLADVVGDQTATRRAQLNVLGALAVLALVLTAVGIHGLLSFAVAQRDREIGVRLALGASPRGVARMIMSEGMRIALAGVVPGVFVAWLAARGMSALLFGVPPADPVTIGVVAFACVFTTVIACARPALRAAGVHPMAALRSD